MDGHSSDGNREIPPSATRNGFRGPHREPYWDKAMMNEDGKSDSSIVPGKQANKGGGAPSAKNLANAFTPTEPMSVEGLNPERIRAKGDVPKALKAAIDQGMDRIGLTCLKQNAKIFLSIYEDICLKHVLDKQIQGKYLKKLLTV